PIPAVSASFCFCITAVFGTVCIGIDRAWLWYIGLSLLGTGHAVYSSSRYALLPAAAQDACLPLNRITGGIDFGCSSGMVGGLLVGCYLHGISWPESLV